MSILKNFAKAGFVAIILAWFSRTRRTRFAARNPLPTFRMRSRYPPGWSPYYSCALPDRRSIPVRLATDGKFSWTLKAPEAELKDRNDKVIGQHSAGSDVEVERWQRSDRESGRARRLTRFGFGSVAAGECCEQFGKRGARHGHDDSAGAHARWQAWQRSGAMSPTRTKKRRADTGPTIIFLRRRSDARHG